MSGHSLLNGTRHKSDYGPELPIDQVLSGDVWLPSRLPHSERSAHRGSHSEMLVTDRRFGVIIGNNGADNAAVGARYSEADMLPTLYHAEDDARAIFDVLCDPRTGMFDSADVRLFIGPDFTADQVKATLMDIVGRAGPTDALVVYFAGHSLTPDWSRATDTYLVTPDLNAADLERNPDAGLRMAFLKRDVLDVFPGHALLLLDCCRAGTLLTAPGRDFDLISVSGRQGAHYTALMACTAEGFAREDPRLGHGVLTYHALRAMRGEAADARGKVTFQSLGSFVTSQDISPEPGFVTQTWGRGTVLTRPGPPTAGRPAVPAAPDYIKTTPLENPLDRFVPAIRNLIDRISYGARNSIPVVEFLKTALDADSVAVLERTTAGFKPIDSTLRFDLEYAQDLLRAGDSMSPLWFGHRAADESRSLLCVPLRLGPGRVVVLAAMNPAPQWPAMGEPIATILKTVWRTGRSASPDELAIQVLTDLREAFGRLPRELYERYRRLHRRALQSLSMVFQPIVTIEAIGKHVGVHSFEALARRSLSEVSAPVALLQTAHVWGDGQVVERDEIIVAKALSAYADAHREGPWDVPRPVSVNVAVRSLLSDRYVGTLREALGAARLNPVGVTLEIAERDPIAPHPDEEWPGEPHAYFNQRLVNISRDLGIEFALDDFGVERSSVSRMAGLPFTHIKVDRAVLHHQTALETLDYVARSARHARDRGETNAPRMVIVEGVDHQSPVTLRQIYDAQIRQIQGYITQQPAAPTLRQLRDDVREDIAARVRG
ncbi:EAL domain-containing protein [Actinoplanes sp. NPDC051861]|uniref:EAL domain-containing protein n=1 Tax=Actinoplanes sp. NPDC051861 TaxID=3155170 RepID=UPI0034426810